ncbi:MAG: cytochrome c oxidase subunit 2 [Cognaticolwellia sp.]|jgi:cytochrome c oxidase subunit 2
MTLLLLSLFALDVPDQAIESLEDVAAPDPGESAYATCGGCHGAQGQGNPAMNAPALAGQDADYTARQLRNYKAGIRGADPEDVYGAQMRGMSNVLIEDAAVVAVSEYIATLERPSAAATTATQAELSAGQSAYMNCVSCHGQNGQGNPVMMGPALAGLDAPYVERQLEHFRAGRRGAHTEDAWGASMVPLAKQLDAETSVAIAAYLTSL